jgi:hypothetical protein
MPIDLADPKVKLLHERMTRLNAFITEHVVAPVPLKGLRRIFSGGEAPSFNWNKGGRVYAVGGGYQMLGKAERRGITIDGEPTVEIDVKASFITILSAMRGMPLPHGLDPYEVSELPREVAKAAVTMTLGHDRFHVRWPTAVKNDLEERLGVSVSKVFPLHTVKERLTAALPAMENWGRTGISWMDLQYVESEALLTAVERLAYEHRVPTLPLHDSLIVPVSSSELAMEVLAHSFEEVVGVRPLLTMTKVDLGELGEGDSRTE